MIIALIFLLHIVFLSVIVYKRWKNDSLNSALIDFIFIIVIFSVGWSLTTMFAKLFWDPTGFGKYFDRDAISLTFLTICEFFFYKIYFKDLLTTEDEKEK